MNYPGGKGLSFQKYINLMPRHDVYIETFLGGGSIIRNKLPANRNIGIEINQDVVNKWHAFEQVNFELIHGDAMDYLRKYSFIGNELIYCDPPYMRETRRSRKKIYKYEYTNKQHVEFLELIKSLTCMVMISGYHSELYEKHLSDWYIYSFKSTIRKQTATEVIWMNYSPPRELHDYRYLGDNFRERERLKMITTRWVRRFRSMPILEQQALFHAIKSAHQDCDSADHEE